MIDEAADGANPKVTFLPSHTRPQCGQGRVRRAGAQSVRTANGRTVRGASPILAGLEAGGNEQLAPLTGMSGNGAHIPAVILPIRGPSDTWSRLNGEDKGEHPLGSGPAQQSGGHRQRPAGVGEIVHEQDGTRRRGQGLGQLR